MNFTSILIIIGLLFILLVYKLVTYLYYLRLKKDLNNANLDFFIQQLGNKYQYKHLTNGSFRYKWAKRWIIIRANFDENGNFVKTDMASFNFIKILSEFTFL